ncbi:MULTISPECIES: Crp/Fnr family transcriptional regulator [Listeria]|nr:MULTISPECIES: Crp/Fnr family transcriptional regulator [Listeria]
MHELMMGLYTKKEVYDYFNELQLKELLTSNLQGSMKKIRIDRSRVLLSKTENTKVYFILSGIVAARKDGNLLYFRGENRFIGLESILFSEDSELVTLNIGKVELIEFPKVEVLELLMGLQEGWLYCYLINKDLNQVLMRNYSNFQAKPYERSKQMLTDLAKEFGGSSELSVVLPKQFTLTILTNYLGISYVTMRKILEILRDENFIVDSGKRKEIRIQAD